MTKHQVSSPSNSTTITRGQIVDVLNTVEVEWSTATTRIGWADLGALARMHAIGEARAYDTVAHLLRRALDVGSGEQNEG